MSEAQSHPSRKTDFPHVQRDSAGEPLDKLTHINRIAAMEGIILKGPKKEEGGALSGKLLDGDSTFLPEFKGQYWVNEKAVRIWSTHKRRRLSNDVLQSRLNSLLDELHRKPLRVMESGLERMKSRLQQTESSREVYIAFWKSSPYFIFAYAAALLTAEHYVNLDLWSNLPRFAAVPVIVGIAGVISWILSRRRDSDIVTMRIYSGNVERLISERLSQVKSELGSSLKQNLPQFGRTISKVYVAEDGTVSESKWLLNKNLNEDRLKDVQYKYPQFALSLKSLEAAHDSFRELFITFCDVANKAMLAIDEAGGVKDQLREEMPSQIRGLYRILSGQTPTLEALEAFEEDNIGSEQHFIKDFLPDDSHAYKPLLESKVRALAKECEVKRQEYVSQLEKVSDVIDYMFWQPANVRISY